MIASEHAAPAVLAQPEGADPLSAEVFLAFMRIAQRQRELFRRALAKQHLHPAQAMCLRVLAHNHEIGQSELADVLMLSRPSVTRVLQRLERAGLVSRRVGATDQRQSLVTLTPAGSELQRRLHLAMAEHLTTTIAQLPEDDRRTLARLLTTWNALVDNALDANPLAADPVLDNSVLDNPVLGKELS